MKLYVAGIGCGSRNGITIEAEKAILSSDIVVGYTVYIEQIKSFYPEKECISTGMKQERERVELALRNASDGKTVALVCSGDSQLYGMAGLAIELSVNYPEVDIEVIPGVTAAFSGGAVLGAPMTHDLALISLSDLLTPMEKIIKRLRCAAEGDFVIALYNPSSKKRADYLQRACDIILEYRSPETVCGIVGNIGREGQQSRVLMLNELRETQVDMFTTVFIGNSETKVINGKMVTPRGYRNV
ncbi:precorrin-3B C(17)-methyltransferase [uncultured Ruminococcus sp.]|uniref:precorrin-3B C(17)-methyltransferase n=1 Tax=uncultured Ruminococcus sp. TaxID=165186 RepID=UPI0025E52907|nr:precorrin-3B C(17)-methyltransferase [uncultured Ruminococcus sp.]